MLVASNMRILTPIETEDIFCRVIFDISTFRKCFLQAKTALSGIILPTPFLFLFFVVRVFHEVRAHLIINRINRHWKA